MDIQKDIDTRFYETSNKLTDKTLRAGALLRLMQFRFKEGGRLAEPEEDDMAELVDVCLESMPHHFTDVNYPLDELISQYRRAMQAEAKHAACLNTILDSMQIVARLDASCEDLTAAATEVHNLAEADKAYEQDWRTLKETIEARGLYVETVTRGVSVTTKALRAAHRRFARATSQLVKQCNIATELGREKPIR